MMFVNLEFVKLQIIDGNHVNGSHFLDEAQVIKDPGDEFGSREKTSKNARIQYLTTVFIINRRNLRSKVC